MGAAFQSCPFLLPVAPTPQAALLHAGCHWGKMATNSSVLAWRTPGTEEPGGSWSIGSQSRTRLKQLSTYSSELGNDTQAVNTASETEGTTHLGRGSDVGAKGTQGLQ